MITFIDDTLGFPALHFLQSKADVVTALQDLVTWAEAQTGYHLCSIYVWIKVETILINL